MKTPLSTLFILFCLVSVLFEPYKLSNFFGGLYIGDYILFAFIAFMFAQKLILMRISKLDLYWILFLFFFVFFSLIQSIAVNMPVSYALDNWKIAKATLFLIFLGLYKDNVKMILLCFKIYIFLDIAISLTQILLPSLSIWSFFAVDISHLVQIRFRPIGFMENSTQAGFVAAVLLYVFALYKNKTMTYITFGTLIMHTNKMSIIIGFMILIYFQLTSHDKLNFASILKIIFSITLLSVTVITIAFMSPFFSSFIFGMQTGGFQNDTFLIRYNNFLFIKDLYATQFKDMLFLGYPFKENWPIAFDNQFFLLNARYGLLNLVFIYLFLFAYLKRNKLLYFLILGASVTMINFYHIKTSLIIALAIYLSHMYYKNTQQPELK